MLSSLLCPPTPRLQELSAAKGTLLGPPVYVIFCCGLRIDEGCALTAHSKGSALGRRMTDLLA